MEQSVPAHRTLRTASQTVVFDIRGFSYIYVTFLILEVGFGWY
jgi:hypothetical protein